MDPCICLMYDFQQIIDMKRELVSAR